jgi:O-antigen/teichoic acid export membrane protein
MHDFKLFAQRVGLVGVTNLLSGTSGIFLLPILSKNLSVGDYGVWAQVNATLALLSVVVLLGLPSSMIRFLAPESDKRIIQEGFYSIFIVVLLSASISALLAYLLSEPISATLFGGDPAISNLLPLIIFIDPLNNILFNYFRTYQQIKRHSLFLLTNAYLAILFIAYFVVSGYGIEGALIGLLINKLILFLMMFSLVASEIGMKVPNLRNIRTYLGFGLPIIPGNLAGWVINSSDRYLIGMFLGTAFVGYYSPGNILGGMINLFTAPLSFMLPSILCKYYDRGESDKMKIVLKFSLKYFLAIAVPATFGLSLLSRPILEVLSTPEIAANGYLVTPLIASSCLLLGVFAVISNIIVLEKKAGLSSRIWIVAAFLDLIMNFIFIPRLNIIGAALTALLTLSFVLVMTHHYSTKYLILEIDYPFILKSLLASIIMSLAITRWVPVGLLQVLIVVCIGAAVYFAVLLLLRGLTRQELMFFADIFGKRS